ncbi:MAG: protein-tyrosine phosphatase family protein [Bryobacteraceae bacterium]
MRSDFCKIYDTPDAAPSSGGVALVTPQMFPIPGPWRGRLAISARPRGGDWLADEVRGWRTAGVDAVVSLLGPEEEQELGLDAENTAVEDCGIRFVSYPIADRSVPHSVESAVQFLRGLSNALDSGESVVVHCRQGIGRSALIAAGALVVAGVDPVSAVRTVADARGVPVPETAQQRSWIEQLTNRLVVAR